MWNWKDTIRLRTVKITPPDNMCCVKRDLHSSQPLWLVIDFSSMPLPSLLSCPEFISTFVIYWFSSTVSSSDPEQYQNWTQRMEYAGREADHPIPPSGVFFPYFLAIRDLRCELFPIEDWIHQRYQVKFVTTRYWTIHKHMNRWLKVLDSWTYAVQARDRALNWIEFEMKSYCVSNTIAGQG